MSIEKNQLTDKMQLELAEAEQWFTDNFKEQLTVEQMLKLILYKLDKIESQSERINTIL